MTRPASGRAPTRLARLDSLRTAHGAQAAAERLALLDSLEHARLASAAQVLRLHEILLYLRAFPDDAALLARVEAMLAAFSRRADLKRHRAALADSGIAGCPIRYRFFWGSARWLAARWPDRLRIDWASVDDPERIGAALPLLAAPLEAVWLRACRPSPKAALARLAGAHATDAAWLVRAVTAMPGDDFTREAFFDALDTPMVLAPARDSPSRTRSRFEDAPVVIAAGAPARERPRLDAELALAPRSVLTATPRQGARLVDMAREAMVTRSRDLDAFAYGNPRDVLIVDDGNGLQWALIGMLPERRAPLRAAWGFLTLASGVPIGYGQLDALFGCVDISFNAFDAFRGAGSARVFVRLLAACRHVLGARAFSLEPYQLGDGNPEAIASGAWWFYTKLGFRPRDPAIARCAGEEIARMRADPLHRSSRATLRRLARGYLVYETAGARAPDWTRLASLGERCAGAGPTVVPRGDGVRAALARLGIGERRRLGHGERVAWQRWAPLLALLRVEHWSAGDRRALAGVIDARGGESELRYLRLFERHPRLGREIRAHCGG